MYRYLLLTLLLTGCAAGPNYHRPAVAGTEVGWMTSVDGAPFDEQPWHSLGDPVLTRLIESAIAHNPDVREVEANLREARAQRDATAGQRLPELTASASAEEDQISANGQLPVRQIPNFNRRFSLFDAGFDASWEIDLWGGTRRAVEGAERHVEAESARQRDTMLQVVAEVARTYAELRGSQAAVAAQRADADAQSAISRLIHQRFEAGEASNVDDVRAQAQARDTAAAIAGKEAAIHAAANELALLTGRPPEESAGLATTTAPIPLPPARVAAGMRSDLLRRRPDIRAAEADLAAATSDVGVETANLFPTVSLVGSLGQQARHGSDLGTSASTYSTSVPRCAGQFLRAGAFEPGSERPMPARTRQRPAMRKPCSARSLTVRRR